MVFHFATAQTYTYDQGGRLTDAVYSDWKRANYSYDPTVNIVFLAGSNTRAATNTLILTILKPLAGNANPNASLSISGTATGTSQVIFVFFQINHGALQLATTTNAWTNWSGSANLVLGSNAVTVLAQDAAGLTSTNRVNVNFIPPPVLRPVDAATFTAGQVQLQLIGVPGFSYTLQSATNLTFPTWLPVVSSVANTNGSLTFTDTNTATLPARFYRAVAN